MVRVPLVLVKPACGRKTCPLFEQVHPKCKGHTRAGNPCKQPTMKGQFVCRMHGGMTPEALGRGVIRESMWASIVAFDPTDPTTPEEQLLRQVLHSGQVAEAYRQAVIAWDQDDAPAALVEAWTNERDRAAKLAKLALDAGIAKRQVELAENQAGMLVQVIVNVLTSSALGLSAEQIVVGKQHAAEALRMLPTGGT